MKHFKQTLLSKPIKTYLILTFSLGWLLQIASRTANSHQFTTLFTLLLMATALVPGLVAWYLHPPPPPNLSLTPPSMPRYLWLTPPLFLFIWLLAATTATLGHLPTRFQWAA
ncbi:MAG TPA: hypothetical protein VLL52_24845, partial [Anaerolineae bacterium]|nr:hypothetical protein [Anaerolineae bacterium]